MIINGLVINTFECIDSFGLYGVCCVSFSSHFWAIPFANSTAIKIESSKKYWLTFHLHRTHLLLCSVHTKFHSVLLRSSGTKILAKRNLIGFFLFHMGWFQLGRKKPMLGWWYWCYLKYGRNMYVNCERVRVCGAYIVLCYVVQIARHILCMWTIIIIIDISSVWLYLLLWHIVFIDFLFLCCLLACVLCSFCACSF